MHASRCSILATLSSLGGSGQFDPVPLNGVNYVYLCHGIGGVINNNVWLRLPPLPKHNFQQFLNVAMVLRLWQEFPL